MVKVFVERENKNKEISAKDGKELVSKLNINPETVLIVRNNEVLTEGVKLNEKDEIKLLSVISGG